MRGEIWLCRTVRSVALGRALRASDLNDDSHQAVMAKVLTGELGTLSDGSIIEPLSSHATEADAVEAMRRAAHDNPGEDYRVVITVEVCQ